jgi:hypothetical protein
MKVFNESEEGLFGSSLNWINSRLPYLYKNKIYPHWDIRNVNHGNPSDQDRITPHIIKPKKQTTNSDTRVDLLSIERYQYTNFKEANFYFNEYFEFCPSITDQLDIDFIPEKCLGIHFRGTDKLTNNKDCKIINLTAFLLKLESFLKDRCFESVFVISDEADSKQTIISFVKNLGVTVLSTHLPPHFHKTLASNPDKLSITKNSILEMLLLSKCGCVIKSHSAFSSWAKIINPSLEMYRVNECKNNWFPDHYLPEF